MTDTPPITNNIPANITALNVILPGEHYNVKLPVNLLHYDKCPPLRPLTDYIKRNRNFENLTGFQFGRFTVVGLSNDYKRRHYKTATATNETIEIRHHKRSDKGRCLWVVRCSCGAYEVRTTKTIKEASHLARCYVCESVLNGKRKQFKLQYGRKPTKEEMKGW